MLNIKIENNKTIFDFENKVILNDFKNRIDFEDFNLFLEEFLKQNRNKIDNINFENNMLIHSNNLLGLNILKEKLKNKMDVIYIDPPYYFNKMKSKNSFKYNSNFELDEWLLFLNSRLEIALDMLTDDGIIFISINDEGVYHLKILCDQIFGIENHLTTIKWNKKNSQNDTEYFQDNIEHILVYKKDLPVVLKEKEISKQKVIIKDGKSYLKKGMILKGGEDGFLNNSATLGYSIYYNPKNGEVIPIQDYDINKAKTSNSYEEIYENPSKELLNKGYVLIRPPFSKGRIKRWTWGIEKMKKEFQKLLFVKNNKGEYSIYSLKEIDNKKVYDGYYEEEKYKSPKNIIEFQSSKGSSRINDLFKGQENFAYSKPVELINYLLELLVKKNDIKVLDFFAGSGTTGESVLMLNKKDGGNRKFYLIEQMDYANSLTFERLKKVKEIEDIKEDIDFETF